MTYPVSFRQHVMRVKEEEKLSFSQTASRFKIGKTSLVRWSNCLTIKPQPMRKRKLDLEKLVEDIRLYPDSYHDERAARFGVVASSICEAMKRLGYSHKKKLFSPQSRRATTQTVSRTSKGIL